MKKIECIRKVWAVLEELKQRFLSKVVKTERYNERVKQFNQNRLFPIGQGPPTDFLGMRKLPFSVAWTRELRFLLREIAKCWFFACSVNGLFLLCEIVNFEFFWRENVKKNPKNKTKKQTLSVKHIYFTTIDIKKSGFFFFLEP